MTVFPVVDEDDVPLDDTELAVIEEEEDEVEHSGPIGFRKEI